MKTKRATTASPRKQRQPLQRVADSTTGSLHSSTEMMITMVRCARTKTVKIYFLTMETQSQMIRKLKTTR